MNNYYISYKRSVTYGNGSITEGFRTDEERSADSVETIIENIENNDKFLSLREDDVINAYFNDEHEISESVFEYYVLNEDKEIVSPDTDNTFDIIIDNMGSYMDGELDDTTILQQLGYESGDDIPDDKYNEVNIEYRTILTNNIMSLVLESPLKQYVVSEISCHPNLSFKAFIRFSSKLPLYALNNMLLQFSENNDVAIKGFDLTSGLAQSYLQGDLDSGSMTVNPMQEDDSCRNECEEMSELLK